MYKIIAACAVAISMLAVLPAEVSAAPACKGKMVARPAPGGGTRMVCIDGRYATCVADSWGSQGVARCNQLRSEGKLK